MLREILGFNCSDTSVEMPEEKREDMQARVLSNLKEEQSYD